MPQLKPSESKSVAELSPAQRLYDVYLGGLKWLVMALAYMAGAGIIGIILVTCVDVIFRKLGRPVPGALDLVTILGTVTMACALPYTTAVKGHVAIEFLYQKLSRGGRVVTDTFSYGEGSPIPGLLREGTRQEPLRFHA